jgi:hypothetical protein
VPGSFIASDFVRGVSLVREADGQVGVVVAALVGGGTGSGEGELGRLKLEILPGFAGAAEVEIVRTGIRLFEGDQVFTAVSEIVTITDEVVGDGLIGDFDGDGVVDAPDFFLFAAAFWSQNADIDLSGDGFVDFTDLFLFAEAFGQEAPLFKLVAMLEDYIGLPIEPRLEANYPNPFNGQTVIPFALPTAADVRIDVFDLLGQRVRTLVDGSLSAGLHQVRWDGRGDGGMSVAAGVYFYRLRADLDGRPGFSAVRKLTLAQ